MKVPTIKPAPPAKNREVRLSALARITLLSLSRPWLFVGSALVLAGVSVLLASKLEIRSSFEELLPSDVPSVAQIKELIRRLGGDGTVLVTIERTGGDEGLAPAMELAPKLAQDFLALGPETIRSIEYNMKPVEAWYALHWPLFVPLPELERARDVIKREVRRVKRERNPLLALGGALPTESTEQNSTGKSDPNSEADAWLAPGHALPSEQVRARFARYNDGFFVAPDKKSLTLVVRPTGTALGVHEAQQLLDRLHAIADRHQAFVQAHHLRLGFGGTFPLFVAEYQTIIHDVLSTALLCVGLVLASLMLFFRDLRSTISLGISVLLAIAVTAGITRLVIGYLNTQTAFLGSIVLGNGINYGLIYLARVSQLRRGGMALRGAVLEGAQAAAQATLLAATATSVSFATLILAANRGFRHFGFIGGIGMLLCWAFTFVLLPALLSIFEKIHAYPAHSIVGPPEPNSRACWMQCCVKKANWVGGIYGVLAIASILLFLHHMPTVLERNLENMTNQLKGQETLIRDNERANSGLGKSLAGAVALFPDTATADKFCAVIRQRQEDSLEVNAVVQGCDALSSVVPSDQVAKLAVIDQIIQSLSDLVIESFSEQQQPKIRQLRAELQAAQPLQLSEAPASLIDRFRERDGSVGRLAVITARPSAHLELAANLSTFVGAVRQVPVDGHLYDASGENVIFRDLLKDIEHEGPLTTLLSLVGVCLLVLVFFRNICMSATVLTSLLVGVILMGGFASLLDLKINFFNFIVFPITFGVAVDYGANVSVRVRERGGNILAALYEVAPAVALCSWTSIIGYGSLIFALNRALRSFGWYAMIGELTTLSTALFLLPAMLAKLPRAPQAGDPS